LKPALHPVSLPLPARTESPHDFLRTGVETLDQLLSGGLPRGKITEISGDPSSGRTSLLLCILTEASHQRESLAYVDAFDMLDPASFQRSGVDLDRLLWIRCRNEGERDRVNQSIKAADIVTRSGGFGVLILDLGIPRNTLPPISTRLWFRLQRTIRGTSTSLVVITPRQNPTGASTLRLELERCKSDWGGKLSGMRQPLLEGIHSHATLTRGPHHGRVALHCRL